MTKTKKKTKKCIYLYPKSKFMHQLDRRKTIAQKHLFTFYSSHPFIHISFSSFSHFFGHKIHIFFSSKQLVRRWQKHGFCVL